MSMWRDNASKPASKPASKQMNFLICPIRKVSFEESQEIARRVSELEANGVPVYWPARDTDQNDRIGVRICTDNRAAIEAAGEVLVWWSPESSGSLFDLGMAFALRKTITLLNNVSPTEQKSFQNVLLALDKL